MSKRALIIRVSSLGDIIRALPTLDYLKNVVAGIEIDWLVDERYREVLEGNPLVAQIQTVRPGFWRKHLFSRETRLEMRRLRSALMERDYDFVFDLQGGLGSGLLGMLSGCEKRIGFSPESLPVKANQYFTTQQVPLRAGDSHCSDQFLRLVSVPFGRDFKAMSLCADITTSAVDDSMAEALLSTLSDGLVFLFHQGAAVETRLWYEEGWIELGRMILSRFPDSSILVSWGTDDERSSALRVTTAIGNGARFLDSCGLKSYAALLKKVDMVVCCDAGPLYLAAAVKTPTVSLYRSSDFKRRAPRGESHGIVQAPLDCARCLRSRCDRDDQCRRSITPEMVMKAIGTVFQLPDVA